MPRTNIGKSASIIALCLIILGMAASFLLSSNHEVSAAAPPLPVTHTAPPLPSAPPSTRTAPLLPTAPPVAGRGGRISGPGVVPKPDNRTCSFDATIYDVRLDPDQTTRLDMAALIKAAATRETFEKALAALGPTRPLYRANQATNLNEEQYIKITNEMPYVAASEIQPGTTTMAFKTTGATFDLISHADDAGTLTVDLAIKASILLNGAVTPATATQMPVFRNAENQYRRTVTPDKPFLNISVDATTLDANGKAVVFITRIILGTPQLPTTTRPAAPPATAP